ncbi:MAG: hypothetical protein N0E59_02145 [Candidatus Thiodiazotropha taylori]|nr:hypothetical protein [Candidatus Thiodiazotropha taylori]MCG8051907.1 hypothetical protein [Candidatus Thiodiazotropha taylori]MCG8108679.1 hypothetical protein [Candidatus Thiodiazotropha taylori]MCG8109543.1 hypothetical protein [Candidatus Thiodiazotropha taylori]MCW4281015.1 hypothetical protein [Candidatus Thiodiazotropha taylori]
MSSYGRRGSGSGPRQSLRSQIIADQEARRAADRAKIEGDPRQTELKDLSRQSMEFQIANESAQQYQARMLRYRSSLKAFINVFEQELFRNKKHRQRLYKEIKGKKTHKKFADYQITLFNTFYVKNALENFRTYLCVVDENLARVYNASLFDQLSKNLMKQGIEAHVDEIVKGSPFPQFTNLNRPKLLKSFREDFIDNENEKDKKDG